MKKIYYLLILLTFFAISKVYCFATYSIDPDFINDIEYSYINESIKNFKDYNYFEISDLANLDYKLNYNYKINSLKKINFNDFKIKEITVYKGHSLKTKYVLVNKNDEIIAVEEKILDIKEDGNILMIVVGGIHQLRVEYIYSLPNVPLFSIGFIIPATVTPNANLKVVSAKILSDNYVKCVFSDGREEIWRCRNFENIFKENFKIKKEDAYITKLVWANDLSQFKYGLRSIELKSYDFIDQDTEPTIEQLKEKFPDDTFFR
ncbi:MAG: hypothetical protein IJS60_11400 [Abditibacteriota bacterium]|nr:hypothetical protein [Abditibacteriota bacterium]